MKREERFVGNGNVWIANSRYRGWQVTCAKCGVSKTITSHDGSSMPPDVIVKRLHHAGWQIGFKSIDDVCPGCQRRRRPAQIINGHAAPAQPEIPTLPLPTDPEAYFDKLRICAHDTLAAAAARRHNQCARFAAELLAMLKTETTAAVIGAMKPPPEPPQPKTTRASKAPTPIAPDPDYEQWLKSLARTEDTS